ncbi:TetR/AcrR family transcriptional regulator [Sphingomonas sp. 37zxx]|uniref:TetR/AcrR family transcriptional regulator n=1 Tax=Sphingomonas sp. 37zxx TaxID=1550073 RepID=UPI000690A9EC|nr:TetR/AcrR family transcriptional regulator [Sphingomonas sp. 37zxx]
MIEAADSLIRDKGLEGFSLRKAAHLAGVSIGAPAHHFGSIKGLLTEVALLGYDSLRNYLNAVPDGIAPDAAMRGLARAYVDFALAHPGRFRLMFRPDLIDREDPRYPEASRRALAGFAAAIGRRDGAGPDRMADLFLVWSSIHGMASLVLDGKTHYLFDGVDAQEFAERILPDLLEYAWPYGAARR